MNPIVQTQRHGDIVVIVVDNPPVNTITAAARAAMREAWRRWPPTNPCAR
jgi:enoyl-CoA hydratase/carnithine racemase